MIELVDVPADRFFGCVAKEPLRGRIPRGDDRLEVDRPDGRGTDLDEGLVVPLLALQLADVVVEDFVAGRLAVYGDGDGAEIDVDERPVFSRAARDGSEAAGARRLAHEGISFRSQLVRVGDQIVQPSSNRLVPRVPEESFRLGVPGRDLRLQISRHDRDGTDLEQRLEVLLLPLELHPQPVAAGGVGVCGSQRCRLTLGHCMTEPNRRSTVAPAESGRSRRPYLPTAMRRYVLLAAVVVLAAGCGSSGDNGEGEETGSPAAAPIRTITITETEFELDPSSVDLEQPGTYAFEVVNDGQVAHALEVEGEGIEEETQTLQPGDRATLTVTLEGGSYELYCPIGDHKDRGMEGTAVVGGSGQSTTTTTEEDSDDGY